MFSNSSGSTVNNPIIVDQCEAHKELQSQYSLQSILSKHQNEVLDPSAEYVLTVDRSTPEKLWQSAIYFYKNVMVKPGKLYKELVIHFNGEAGADTGALRREFFEDTISQANAFLFEGEDDRRIVKKDWGLEVLCEIFGMIVAHSILQEGPGFPCMSPCMFRYLATEKNDECLPVKEDIPLNIATHDLITFIEELNDAASEEEIDKLLDQPSNGYILNNSGWCITNPIIPANKLQFLQHLIHDEVIIKRERNLKAICRGLDYLHLGKLIKMHPNITHSLFVAEENAEITDDTFLGVVTYDEPKDENQARALEYFKEFVKCIGRDKTQYVSLPSLLRYTTGLSTIPPLSCLIIKVTYQQNDVAAIFPKAQVCFKKLLIPVVHTCQPSFNDAFSKALEFGGGYGNI